MCGPSSTRTPSRRSDASTCARASDQVSASRLAHERDLQIGEDFGDLGGELDPGQAAADDRDASLCAAAFRKA